jgi:hypothetical protein
MARFLVKNASPEWDEMRNFAEACAAAGLSNHQAAAARLGALGCTYAELRDQLELESLVAARAVVRHAALSLRYTESQLFRTRVRQRREVLQVMKAGPLSDERELFGVEPAHGQHDRLVAARPHGTVADDVMPDPCRAPLKFIRAVYNLLPL